VPYFAQRRQHFARTLDSVLGFDIGHRACPIPRELLSQKAATTRLLNLAARVPDDALLPR